MSFSLSNCLWDAFAPCLTVQRYCQFLKYKNSLMLFNKNAAITHMFTAAFIYTRALFIYVISSVSLKSTNIFTDLGAAHFEYFQRTPMSTSSSLIRQGENLPPLVGCNCNNRFQADNYIYIFSNKENFQWWRCSDHLSMNMEKKDF